MGSTRHHCVFPWFQTVGHWWAMAVGEWGRAAELRVKFSKGETTRQILILPLNSVLESIGIENSEKKTKEKNPSKNHTWNTTPLVPMASGSEQIEGSQPTDGGSFYELYGPMRTMGMEACFGNSEVILECGLLF